MSEKTRSHDDASTGIVSVKAGTNILKNVLSSKADMHALLPSDSISLSMYLEKFDLGHQDI